MQKCQLIILLLYIIIIIYNNKIIFHLFFDFSYLLIVTMSQSHNVPNQKKAIFIGWLFMELLGCLSI